MNDIPQMTDKARIEELENALRLVYFQLSTMPPLFAHGKQPYGITASLSYIKAVLPNPALYRIL